MYKTILVGIDDSDFSQAALIEAANRVRLHGGRLILAHAVYFDEEEFSIAHGQHERRIEAGKELCAKKSRMLKSEFKIDSETLVREGEPHDVIANAAAENKADLVVMGTHGRRGLKRLIMGSVTSAVISNAPCDTLIVKKPCDECTGRYKSILAAFDGSKSAQKALGRACELAKLDNAMLNVLYVIPRYEEMVEFFKTESIKESLFASARNIMESAASAAASYGVRIETSIREGNAVDGIMIEAESRQTDLIVMGTYGFQGVSRAIMGSSTERVIMNADCPVLAVR